MAIFDAKLEFSDEQDVGQVTGTYAATNTLCFSDTTLESSGLELGAGQPVYFNARVGTEAIAQVTGATSGACTLTLAVVNEADTTIDSSSEVMVQTRAFTEDELTAGAWLVRVALPVDIDKQPYMGVLYSIGGATSAAGTVNAWLDHGPQSSYDTQVASSNI